ncbi:MAG: hypothetical protein B1H06_02765, partial [Candidatus Cloacimonas sp. 4484_143]
MGQEKALLQVGNGTVIT